MSVLHNEEHQTLVRKNIVILQLVIDLLVRAFVDH